jgi:MFS family permease
MALGGATLLMLVSRLGPEGWSWEWIVGLSAVAAVSLGFLVWHERRAAYPILSPELLTRRAIGPSMLASLLFGLGFLSLDNYVPLYVQGGRGGGVTAAAGVVTPVMLTWASSGVIAARLLVRWGFRRTALFGASLIVVGFTGLLVCAVTGAPQWVLTCVLAVTGFGFGPASMSYLLAAQEAVTWQQRGAVTSGITFFRSIGGALGVGLLGAMFNTIAFPGLKKLESSGVKAGQLLDPHASVKVPPEVMAEAQRVITGGLVWVFAAMLGVIVILFFVTILMPSKKAAHAKASEGLEAIG